MMSHLKDCCNCAVCKALSKVGLTMKCDGKGCANHKVVKTAKKKK